jgi:alpha/beta hydrolase family protein
VAARAYDPVVLTTKKVRSAAIGACAVLVAVVATGCISGPLPARTPDPDLTARGYFEREFFLDGNARSYQQVGTWGTDGKWTAQANATTARFRTRLVVQRPADPAKFNGTVLVEWLNVSAGGDIDVTHGAAIDEITREGFGFVGVSAQKVGVDALTGSSRYASLVHPGDQYSYDIFTQAAIALRNKLGTDAFGGLQVRRLLAAGESQSASRFVTYINAIQPLEHAYDGFIVYSRGAGAAPLFPGATMPTPALLRTDGRAPVLDLQTEGDIVVLRSHLARQPDRARFRLWEVAGGSHADEHTLSRNNPPSPTAPGSPCQFRANSANTFLVVGAAVHSLDEWVRYGVAPPHSPRIELGPDPTADDPVVRDADGNARGGIRLPELEVPIATINGLANPAVPGAAPVFQAFCRLFGRTIDFSPAELASRYPTHQGYVEEYVRATNRAVRRGFLLAPDANVLKATAAASAIGG